MSDRSAIIKVSNAIGQTINPATEENQLSSSTTSSEESVLLRRIVKLLESSGTNDIQGRQRVAVETAVITSGTLGAVTTVGNIGLWGGYSPLIETMTASRNNYSNSIRNNLTFY